MYGLSGASGKTQVPHLVMAYHQILLQGVTVVCGALFPAAKSRYLLHREGDSHSDPWRHSSPTTASLCQLEVTSDGRRTKGYNNVIGEYIFDIPLENVWLSITFYICIISMLNVGLHTWTPSLPWHLQSSVVTSCGCLQQT